SPESREADLPESRIDDVDRQQPIARLGEQVERIPVQHGAGQEAMLDELATEQLLGAIDEPGLYRIERLQPPVATPSDGAGDRPIGQERGQDALSPRAQRAFGSVQRDRLSRVPLIMSIDQLL